MDYRYYYETADEIRVGRRTRLGLGGVAAASLAVEAATVLHGAGTSGFASAPALALAGTAALAALAFLRPALGRLSRWGAPPVAFRPAL